MERLKIAILYGTEPNFEKNAFKYFILSLNSIQSTYEFCFPDVSEYPFEEGIVDFITSHKKVGDFIESNKLTADHFVTIITNSFDNNYFTNTTTTSSVITTDVWNKQFSPPSLFEYLIHSICACLIYSQVVPKGTVLTEDQLKIDIGSHRETRGCLLDFTRKKSEERIDILLGYICEEDKVDIKKFYGDKYLQDILLIISRKWIGNIKEIESVAYNLKHVFSFDINRDSGFNKNFWDKIKGKFYDIPGSLSGEVLKYVVLALVAYFFLQLGITIGK
jgi:hypothetical protein